MLGIQDQTAPLGTYTLLGLLALAALFVPLYWRLIPASRRREAHIFASVAILVGAFPGQALALLLAVAWVVYSVRRLRALYENRGGGGATAERGGAGGGGVSAATGSSTDSPAASPAPAVPASPAGPLSKSIVFLHAAPLLFVFIQIKMNAFGLIGYSYFFLRSLHLMIEAGRQRRFPADSIDVAHYLTFVPSFFSGPIDRIARFRETAAPRLTRDDAIEGLYRIGMGVIRKFIFGDALYLWYQYLTLDTARLDTWQLWLAYDLMFLYIYFNFSGYTDIAIGMGRLYGWRLCENFSYPFAARNISQFWRSWHMSFTFWLQDYIFTPVARWVSLRVKGSAQSRVIVSMTAGSFASMAACGLWHYFEWRMLLWAALEGVGLMAGVLYAEGMKKARLEGFHKRLCQSYVYWAVCAFLAIHFNTWLLPLLLNDFDTAWSVMCRMGGVAATP